ncbi:MAG: TIR domain-containing protein [Acidobacteriota bacterium]
MEFESDVFVSYAHIDDQALVEGQKGWIANLHRALEIRLAQLLGKEPRIWRDPKLSGNDVFADKLVDRLTRVALLVSVLSPRYVNSDWCTRELREFFGASESSGGVRIGDKLRVFKVVKTQIPREQHPEELQDVLGYDFFVVDPETGRARELSQNSGPEDSRQYWARLDDLAHDITEALSQIESSAGPAAPVAANGHDQPAVYLAETSFDLKGERDAVKRELLGHGYRVLPDRPLPLVAPEAEAMIKEQLESCQLSVHLVGRNYGIVPEGATESLVVLQNEYAIERGARSGGEELGRLIWMPPDLATDDDRQRKFIESLQVDPRIQQGADILETPLEDFKSAIHKKLQPAEEEEEEVAAEAIDDAFAAADDLCRIYLICDQRDLDNTLALEDYLFDQGFEVIVPIFEGDEAQVRKDHEENLVVCDAVLYYYGAGNELWLRRKLREMQKSAAFGRSKPLRGKAIYVAPPETSQKRRVRTREAIVIPQQQAFDPAALEPFIHQLKG